MSIPKMELMAALLGAQLAGRVAKIYQLKMSIEGVADEFTFWSDSCCVLHWIKNEKQKDSFVANRVKKILDMSESKQWRHVPRELNPADVVSRGTKEVKELLSKTEWFWGPRFLYQDPYFWPMDVSERRTEQELTEPNVGGVKEKELNTNVGMASLTDQSAVYDLLHPKNFGTLSSFLSVRRVLMVLVLQVKRWLEIFCENREEGSRIWKQRRKKVRAALEEKMMAKKMNVKFLKACFRAKEKELGSHRGC